MALVNEIDRAFGFQDDFLAEKIIKQGMSGYDDIAICKIGILFAMSDKPEINEKANEMLRKLTTKHDRTSPYMLLKWIIQIKQGKKGLEAQIGDWARNHPEDRAYSRVVLWMKDKDEDTITLIGSYCRYLEIFWNDDFAWVRAGQLYMKEKAYERAAFCFEEAIGLNPTADVYTQAALARINIQKEKEENLEIARKELSKAVLLDEHYEKAWTHLIAITTDKADKEKISKYYNSIVKTHSQ